MRQTTKASGIGRQTRLSWLLTILAAALCSPAIADDPVIRVARISVIDGEVSYQRAKDSAKDWYDATLNMPLDESDQLYSGPNGRAEIQLSGRNIVRINRDTNLRFTQFNTATMQLALPVGTASFRIDSLDRRQFHVLDSQDANIDDPVYFEVDTPTVAITFAKEGYYRVNVQDDGTTEVIVRRGQAEVYNKEIGSMIVKEGRRMVVQAADDLFQITRLEDKDDWDRWNDRRDDELFSRLDNSRAGQYIPASIPGVSDLDAHGDWIETPDYGWVWSPRAVATDWAPYRQGYWRWYPAYGWTWISYEPWGWVPYHYGRWAWYRTRWCWVPVQNFGWRWSPHLVIFFGGGGSYNRGYRDGYRDGRRDSWYGWCPLGPGERNFRRGDRDDRRLDSFRNYNAPGGVSSIDGRRFDQGRIVVNKDVLRVPTRNVGDGGPSRSLVVRDDDLKPSYPVPARNLVTSRPEITRRLEAPVVSRRTTENPGIPGRASESGRTLPTRTPDSTSQPSTRISDGRIVRPERPDRRTEYRSIERTPPPEWGRTRERTESPREVERNESNKERENSNPQYRVPNRNTEQPARNAPPARSRPESRREEPSSPPPRVEGREPLPEKRRPDPPPRETPKREAPPQRESPPPREAPPREAPPQRQERPAPPPRKTDPPR